MVVIIKSRERLIIQNNTQHPFNSLRCLSQNFEYSLKPCQPILPRIIKNGITGRMNLSCLFGKYEWKTKKINTGKNSIRYFFQVRKNPKKRKKLTGGISMPAITRI
jgi:hypothetical protein